MAEVEIVLAPDVERIARRLIADHYPHLANADDVRLLFVYTTQKRSYRGESVLAKTAVLNPFQRFLANAMEGVGTTPQFVVSVGTDAWLDLTDSQRVALIDHELAYIGQDDETGAYRLLPTPVNEFPAIVERHGAWLPALEDMAAVWRRAFAVPERAPA